MASAQTQRNPDLLSQINTDQELHKAFSKSYTARESLLRLHLDFLQDLILKGSNEIQPLKDRISFAPLSHRIKLDASAKKTLKRRQKQRLERQELKKRLEDCGQNWEQFWKDKGKDHMINDWGYYRSIDDMIDALPDIAGLRICAYFPDDVEVARAFFEELSADFLAEKPIFIDSSPKPTDILRNKVEHLENRDPLDGPNTTENPGNGYKALHVRLQLENNKVTGGEWSKNLPKHTIEVQITTVVMHAWSEVVHDILYKPHGPQPPSSVRNILHVFNGLVQCSEGALNQLKIIQGEEAMRLSGQEDHEADRDLLSSWLMIATRRVLPEADDPRERPGLGKTLVWSHLDHLLAVLKSDNNHTSGKIAGLVKETIEKKSLKSITHRFPLEILSTLAQRYSVPDAVAESSDLELMQTARLIALRLVKVLNMAVYLGIGPQYVRAASNALREKLNPQMDIPLLIDMLELLHHGNPSAYTDHFYRIQAFCSEWDKITLEKLPGVKSVSAELLNLPRRLVDAGFTASPQITNIGHAMDDDNIPVPRELCAFLHDDGTRMHWIPEIVNVAQQMATRAPGGVLRLEEIARRRHIIWGSDYDNRREPIPLYGTRMTFIEETPLDGTNTQILGMLIDRNRVPLCFRSGPGGRAELRVDKSSKTTKRPHPGFFCAIIQPNEASGISNHWKYTESAAEEWTVRRLKNQPISHKSVERKPNSRTDNFFHLAKSLNQDYGSFQKAEQGQGYRFDSSDASFSLIETEDAYVLHQVGIESEPGSPLIEEKSSNLPPKETSGHIP